MLGVRRHGMTMRLPDKQLAQVGGRGQLECVDHEVTRNVQVGRVGSKEQLRP